MVNPDIHHRQSIRLRKYDYAAQGRECLFGGIRDGLMTLNKAGRMVAALWQALPEHYAGVVVDEHVVMPNHFHGIIFLVGAAPCGRPDLSAPKKGHPQGNEPPQRTSTCCRQLLPKSSRRAATGGHPYESGRNQGGHGKQRPFVCG